MQILNHPVYGAYADGGKPLHGPSKEIYELVLSLPTPELKDIINYCETSFSDEDCKGCKLSGTDSLCRSLAVCELVKREKNNE